jgi:hypothetical protein
MAVPNKGFLARAETGAAALHPERSAERRNEQVPSLAAAQRQPAVPHLELQHAADADLSHQAENGSGQEPELHQAPPEGALSADRDEANLGAGIEGVEREHGRLLSGFFGIR